MPITKRSLRDKDKKLTDFFPQRPPASVPVSATSPSPTRATMVTRSATRKRTATRVSTDLDHKSANSSAPPQMRSASVMTTRKRARSPDCNGSGAFSLPPAKLKSPRESKKAIQSNSISEHRWAAIRVTSGLSSRNSSAQNLTPVRMKNNTLAASPSDRAEPVVCSSQSDEAELAFLVAEPRNLGKVVENVHTWRRKTSESAPRAHEDLLPSSPIRSSPSTSTGGASPHFDPPVRSAITSRSSAAIRTPIVAPTCLPSPPDTNALPPLPPTPEPIDPGIKTAKLIAEIKARAFAANQSSDDEELLSFRELEDSDDGDLADDLPLIGNAKLQHSPFPARRLAGDVFSSPLSSAPSTINGTATSPRKVPDCNSPSPLRPTRASARIRKSTQAFRLPVIVTEPSTSVSAIKSASLPPNHRKSHATNPLRALLREKELEHKRGTNSAALRLAEEASKQDMHEVSVTSGDEFDSMSQSHLADEQAAWKAVRECRKSASPVSSDDMVDFIIGDRESKMLGSVAGEAINKILAGDKDGKGKGKAQNVERKMTLGVSLWTPSSDGDMVVDSMSIPPLAGHPILTRLDDFLKNGHTSLLDLALRAGVLDAVPGDILLANTPQLLNIALLAPSQVADAVSLAFRDLWGSNPPRIHMPFPALLFALVQLGASPSILEGLGFPTECVQKNRITPGILLRALRRLLALVRVAGCAGALSSDDVANVALILAVVGHDPLTSSELRTQLNITMDIVCNHGTTDYLLHDIHEKVLNFARQLTAINKAWLVSFFASGNGWTRCIARRLAYCLLTSMSNIPPGQAPSLEPLVLLLSPDVGSCELFDVTNDSTDYEELRHHIDILSVVLTDIASYVEEERAIVRSASSTSVQGSPGRPKRPPVPPLELLRKVLEALQSKIVDNRASHLERSRTKAAIQRLTMRIYFDRMAIVGVRPRRRASTLKAYFSPQRQ